MMTHKVSEPDDWAYLDAAARGYISRLEEWNKILRAKLEAAERAAKEAREVSDYLTGTPDVPEQLVDYAREQVERAEAVKRARDRAGRNAVKLAQMHIEEQEAHNRTRARYAALREAVLEAVAPRSDIGDAYVKDRNALAKAHRLAEATEEEG